MSNNTGISIFAESAEGLERLLKGLGFVRQMLHQVPAAAGFVGDLAEAAVKDDQETAAPPSREDLANPVPAADKPKRGRKVKAGPETEPAPSEPVEPPKREPQPVADLKNPTVEDCRAALQQLCAAKDVETGKAALATFKKADGSSAAKISDVQPSDYPAFVAACLKGSK